MGRELAMQAIPMQAIPLYFELREQEVVGGGEGTPFVVAVRLRGRITGIEEGGSVWLYGVNPAGIAEEGESLPAAYAGFRRALVDAIHDFAGWAENIRQFREEFTAFFLDTSDGIEGDWIAARREIRNGRSPGLDLRPETDDLETTLEIRRRAGRQTSSGRAAPASVPLTKADTLPQARLAV